jgi:hypothetical protein
MKKLLLIAVTYCFIQASHAQSDSTYFEVGMNAIRLVRLGMDNGEIDSEKWNPYMFTCNLGVKRLNLRFGIGHESMFRRELPSSANGQTTSDTTSIQSDVRLGLGWEIGMGKKWDVKLGADFILARRASVFTTKFINEADVAVENKLDYRMRERGLSPFIFLQYHLNKRVSLGTEILWRFSSYTLVETDDSNLNSAKLERKYEGTKRFLQPPSALFVNVRF